MLLSDTAIHNGVCVQEVAATAHEWQLGEALSTTPATPQGSAEAPANGQPEAPANGQPEAPANGQSEGSLALLQAPAPQIPTQIPATQGATASASAPQFPAAADTTESTTTAGVPPAMGFAIQHAPPAPMDSTAPEPARTPAAQAITGVPPAMTDASLDLEEEESSSASEALAAGASSGKGSEAIASATISEPEPRTGTEGKAAPDSPSDLSVVDAEHSTHAAEGFSDDRAAPDSPGGGVWATTPVAQFKVRTTPRDPAAESEGDTIAAKHAARPAFTMPEDLPGSSSPRTQRGRQLRTRQLLRQLPQQLQLQPQHQLPRRCSSHFAPPHPQQQPQQALQMLTCQHLAQQSPSQ